ncbi:hypothetical protein M0812_10110 [Anaeramoeba flamelloides]|uniref:Uncharacterized protein n=1 Tax=Anaeramoeba flamelloides TaxID=1746091 RepID=A0AAV7ZV24_9EUKA|nr:hypothetical protein M0812_10110 [Anaeramoeba flamelloides]
MSNSSLDRTLGELVSSKRLFQKENKRKTHKNTLLESHLHLQNLLKKKKNKRRSFSNTIEFERTKRETNTQKNTRKKNPQQPQTNHDQIFKDLAAIYLKSRHKKQSTRKKKPTSKQRVRSEHKPKRLFSKRPKRLQQQKSLDRKHKTTQKIQNRNEKNLRKSKFEKANDLNIRSDLTGQSSDLLNINKTTSPRSFNNNKGNNSNVDTSKNSHLEKEKTDRNENKEPQNTFKNKLFNSRSSHKKEYKTYLKNQEILRKENENLRQQIEKNQTRIQDLENTLNLNQVNQKKMKTLLLTLSKNLKKTTLELSNERKKSQLARKEVIQLNKTLRLRDYTIIQLSTDLDKTKRKSRKRINSKLILEKKKEQLASKLNNFQQDFYQFRVQCRSLKKTNSNLRKKNSKLINLKGPSQLDIKKSFTQIQEQSFLICKQYFEKMSLIENICNSTLDLLSNFAENGKKKSNELDIQKKFHSSLNNKIDSLANHRHKENRVIQYNDNHTDNDNDNGNGNDNHDRNHNSDQNQNKWLFDSIEALEQISLETKRPIHGIQLVDSTPNLDLSPILQNFNQFKSKFKIYKIILKIFQPLILFKSTNSNSNSNSNSIENRNVVDKNRKKKKKKKKYKY